MPEKIRGLRSRTLNSLWNGVQKVPLLIPTVLISSIKITCGSRNPAVIQNPGYASKNTYKKVKHFNFQSLRKTWQYEINRLLTGLFKEEFRKIANTSYNDYNNGFYVYAKSNPEDKSSKYSKNVSGCVNYMMCYASRPPMAESRLISYIEKTDDISWFYDDHKTEERITVHEKGIELLKKMIIHIPDKKLSHG